MSDDGHPGAEWAPALEVLPNPIATIDREGRILYVNRTATGEPPSAAIGISLYDVVPAGDRDKLRAVIASVFEQGKTEYYQAFAEPPGRWYEGRFAPMYRDGRVVAAVIVSTDITERKASELALEAAEARARALLQAIPDMIFRLDREGRILDYVGDDKAPAVAPSVFLGKRMSEVLPENFVRLYLDAIAQALERQQVVTLGDYVLPRQDGELRHFEARLVPCSEHEVIAIARDVSDRLRTESALASSERNFRIVTEQIPDAVLIHRGGVILYANPAVAGMLGVESRDELIGQRVVDWIHPEDQARLMERMKRMDETLQPAPSAEFRLQRKDGGAVTIDVAPVQFIEFAGGRASLAVFRDVTQRKRMQERLLLADRVTSMGNLAAGLAHEINNPLTYVIGNLSVASRTLTELSTTPGQTRLHELEKVIADARSGAERVRYIVSDLRAFTMPDHGELVSVDLRKVLDAAVNVAWSEIRHRARLVREYEDTPNVRGSESRLGQVFLNLLINAAQAIAEGETSQNRIEISTRRDPDGRAHVAVRDTGRGFSADVAARMWDPFFTTKPLGEGSGLGLAICQSIVTSLGGDIWAEPSAKGSVFHVLLSPFEGPAQVDPARVPVVHDEEIRRGRILVVDDEPVIAAMVRRALDAHDVYLMTSGRDALELCREMSFDLIIVDLLMPDVTGMDLYEALRAFQPGLEERVVFMTAGAFTPRARNFLAQVSSTVVQKPFDIEQLQAVVQARLRALAPS